MRDVVFVGRGGVYVGVPALGRGPTLISSAFLNHTPHQLLKQDLPLNLELSGCSRLAGHQASGIVWPLPLWCRNYRCLPLCPASYMGAMDLHTGRHACPGSISPSEHPLPPQSPRCCLKLLDLW